MQDVTSDPGLRIPVGDETVAATRFRPSTEAGPLPVLLWATPYHKEREQFRRYGQVLEYLAAHGYEVVLANLLGTGLSSGRFAGLTSSSVGSQCATIIEWLADQKWTTGRVGVIGKSAGGYTCLAAAAADPDPLEAVMPIMHPTRGRRTKYAPGGLFRLTGHLAWIGLYAVMAAQPSSSRDDAGLWRERWDRRLDLLRNEGPAAIGVPALFTENGSSQLLNHDLPLEQISVPTLAVSGFRDRFAPDAIEYVRAIDAPARLLLGPWRHVLPHKGRETTLGDRRLAIDWFDQFLKDEPNHVLDGPVINYWTERNGGRQVDGGIWRGRDTWPTVDEAADPVAFTVTADGLTHGEWPEGEDRGVEHTYGFDQTVGVASMDFASDFLDTGPDDVRALSFETPVLDSPVEWTGTGEAMIQVASTTSEAALCIRVIDVAPDCRARLVTHGAQRLGDGPEGLPMEVGESRPVTVGLHPVSHVFEAGHKVRLAIAAADFPRYLPVGSDGEFTVTSLPDRPTSLTFPGRRPPSLPFEDSIELPAADDTWPAVAPGVVGGSTSGEITRSVYDGTTTVSREFSVTIEYPNVEKTTEVEREITVAPDDPDSVVGQSRYESTLHHDTDPVRVTADTRITQEELHLTLEVAVDQEVTFEETWTD